MTISGPTVNRLGDAATIVSLGCFLGAVLFAVGMALLTIDSNQQSIAAIGLSVIVFALVAALSATVFILPLGVVLVALLLRNDAGKGAGAAACVTLGCVSMLAFSVLLTDSEFMGMIIPAPGAQGAATAYIYMRFSDV